MTKKFALFFGDITTFYGALAVVLWIRYPHGFRASFDLHFLPFTTIFLLWLLVFYIFNLYEIGFAKNDARFFSNFIYAIASSSLISVALFYLIPLYGITPKTNLAIFVGIYAALGLFWRYGFNKIVSKTSTNNTLIIGNSEQAQEMYDFLLANKQLGYNALGIIDISQIQSSQLEEIIIKKNVKTLVLGPSTYKASRIIDTFYRLLGLGIIFYNLSDFYERVTNKVPLGEIDQAWFLSNLTEGSKRGYEIFRRVFDIGFAVLLGIVSLLFYPLIILAIKLDSRGPIFFKQKRIGKAGKIFTLIKFRNMIANSPDGSAEGGTGPIWADARDPRVTQVGGFLRRSRIDELPQLWNVLKGDMSFVGPRPERPEFHNKLKQEIPFYEERYLIKPGLTGWAQIKHRINGMSIKDTFEKLQYDLFYIKNRSILLDLTIILKTMGKLLLQEGK